MVARPRSIRCAVFAVPLETASPADRQTARTRWSSELVPGADPYIARLIKKLQAEVRLERSYHNGGPAESPQSFAQPQALYANANGMVLEAELPWFDEEPEDNPYDFDGDRFLEPGEAGDFPLSR